MTCTCAPRFTPGALVVTFSSACPVHSGAALTDRQREACAAIDAHVDHYGYGPTVRELCAALGIRSTNGMFCKLVALERKGVIRWGSHARDLRMLPLGARQPSGPASNAPAIPRGRDDRRRPSAVPEAR